MSSVPNQLQELRDELARMKDRLTEIDKDIVDLAGLVARIFALERENAAWRDAFSRGSLPPPRPVVPLS